MFRLLSMIRKQPVLGFSSLGLVQRWMDGCLLSRMWNSKMSLLRARARKGSFEGAAQHENIYRFKSFSQVDVCCFSVILDLIDLLSIDNLADDDDLGPNQHEEEEDAFEICSTMMIESSESINSKAWGMCSTWIMNGPFHYARDEIVASDQSSRNIFNDQSLIAFGGGEGNRARWKEIDRFLFLRSKMNYESECARGREVQFRTSLLQCWSSNSAAAFECTSMCVELIFSKMTSEDQCLIFSFYLPFSHWHSPLDSSSMFVKRFSAPNVSRSTIDFWSISDVRVCWRSKD